jgi:hypothetical protein
MYLAYICLKFVVIPFIWAFPGLHDPRITWGLLAKEAKELTLDFRTLAPGQRAISWPGIQSGMAGNQAKKP